MQVNLLPCLRPELIDKSSRTCYLTASLIPTRLSSRNALYGLSDWLSPQEAIFSNSYSIVTPSCSSSSDINTCMIFTISGSTCTTSLISMYNWLYLFPLLLSSYYLLIGNGLKDVPRKSKNNTIQSNRMTTSSALATKSAYWIPNSSSFLLGMLFHPNDHPLVKNSLDYS